jgi:chromosome segregation ATPase
VNEIGELKTKLEEAEFKIADLNKELKQARISYDQNEEDLKQSTANKVGLLKKSKKINTLVP